MASLPEPMLTKMSDVKVDVFFFIRLGTKFLIHDDPTVIEIILSCWEENDFEWEQGNTPSIAVNESNGYFRQ